MSSKIWIPIVIVILVVIGYFYFSDNTQSSDIIVKPKFGEFVSTVTVTGELRAINSTDIRGPQGARSIGIWQMKITNLIEEGTLVQPGDFVAELDKSEITNRIGEAQLNIQKIESQYTQAKLDSLLQLSNDRNEIENLKFNLEEKRLQVEQSKYEAPSIIRQAEIELDRIERASQQAIRNYDTKVKQAIAKISAVEADLMKERQKLDQLMQTISEFTIFAPAEGMLIYSREWSGRKKVVGSTIDAWDPIVATLPDLTSMETVTWVNEVDIQKIRESQLVNIGLDANPDKRLTGVVTKVANIGEQRRGSDAKVFEVIIKINERDTTLLPSMTTSNEIILERLDSALYIPLEAMFSEVEGDETTYFVYKKTSSGVVRQQIIPGIMNEVEIVVTEGLNEDDEILISRPANPETIKISLLKESE